MEQVKFLLLQDKGGWALGGWDGWSSSTLPLQTQVQRITDSEFISVASADPEQACVGPVD